MSVRGGKRWWLAGGLVLLAVAAVGLGRFLAGQGLARADQWASVVGLFLTLAGLVVAGYTVVRDRRTQPSAVEGPPVDTVRNTVTDAEVKGPAVLGRDIREADPAGSTEVRPSGNVENQVSGGVFHAPLIMGRDIDGVVLRRPPDEDDGGAAR